MVISHRALVVLNFSKSPVEFSKQGHAIVVAMTNNAWFTNCNPTLPVLLALLKTLDDANAAPKGPGTPATCRTAMRAAKRGFQQEAGFVQTIADQNADKAEEIILSSGMGVKRFKVRQKNTDRVTQGGLSGLVLLMAALAAPKACYLWQVSTDQKTWTNLPQVFRTTTSVSGLTPATMYYFRYKTVTPKHGETDWSQIMSLLVK